MLLKIVLVLMLLLIIGQLFHALLADDERRPYAEDVSPLGRRVFFSCW